MNEHQIGLVWEYLQQSADISTRAALVFSRGDAPWDTLLQNIHRHGGIPLAGVADEEISVVIALWVVGPTNAPPPPVAHHAAVLHVVPQALVMPSQRRARVIEYAVAYGCGVDQEQYGPGTAPLWTPPWAGAMPVLVDAVARAVASAQRWLAQHVVDFPDTNENEQSSNVRALAWVLAERLRAPQHALQLIRGDENLLQL